MRITVDSTDFAESLAAVGSALKALDWKGTCLLTADKHHVVVEASAGRGYFRRKLLSATVEEVGEVTISTEQVYTFPAPQTTLSCSDGNKIDYTSGRMRGYFLAHKDPEPVERIDKEIKEGLVVSTPMLHQMIRTILFEPSTPEIPMSLRLLTKKSTRTVKAVVFDAYRAAVFEQTFTDSSKKKRKHEEHKDKDKLSKDKRRTTAVPEHKDFYVDVLDDVDYSFPASLVNAIYGLFDGNIHIGTSSKLAYFADQRSVLYHPYSSTDESSSVKVLLKKLSQTKPLLVAQLDPAVAQQTIAPACSVISRKDGMLTLTPNVTKKTMVVKVADDFGGRAAYDFDLIKIKARKEFSFSVAYGYLMEFLAQISWYVTPDEDGTTAGVLLRVWPNCLAVSVPHAIYIMPLKSKT